MSCKIKNFSISTKPENPIISTGYKLISSGYQLISTACWIEVSRQSIFALSLGAARISAVGEREITHANAMKIVLLLIRLAFFCCLAGCIFFQCKRGEPVKNPDPKSEVRHDPLTISLDEAREVASFPAETPTRINADSSARTLSREDGIIDQLAVTDSADWSPLLDIFKKERGFAIVSADLRVMPILAFSESSDIDVNNIPNGVSLWLDMAKTKVREARNKGGEPHPIVLKEWQKFLSRRLRIEDSNCIEWYQYGQFQCKNKMTIKGPLISTIWGQKQLSTTKLSTAGDCDGCGRRVAGCGPVAMAQLEEYYHPNLSRPRVSEGKCAASNAGEHSLGTLMKTMGDKAKASYNYMGSCNTFTWPADVKSGLKSFGFSSGGSANEAYNLALIKSEQSNVVRSIAARALNTRLSYENCNVFPHVFRVNRSYVFE